MCNIYCINVRLILRLTDNHNLHQFIYIYIFMYMYIYIYTYLVLEPIYPSISSVSGWEGEVTQPIHDSDFVEQTYHHFCTKLILLFHFCNYSPNTAHVQESI